MSFDLFVGCFENGRKALFPTRLVKHAFAPHITSVKGQCLVVTYGQIPYDSSYVYIDTQADSVDSFSINRPKDDPRLYDTIVEILKSANLALYMPGQCPPLVAKSSVVQHLPPSMVEALGTPKILRSGAELQECIRNC